LRPRQDQMFLVASDKNGGISGTLIPWITLGVSIGAGYFGVEAIISWYFNRHGGENSFMQDRRLSHPLRSQVIRYIQHIENLIHLNNAKAWLCRYWTFQMIYQEVVVGLVVAVMPPTKKEDEIRMVSSEIKEKTDDTIQSKQVLSVNNVSTEKQNSDGSGVFLSLPPHLHARSPPKAPKSHGKKERYLELLLHNISHTDLVLGIDVLSSQPTATKQRPSLTSMCLCRPRFSAFDMYCRRLLKALDNFPPNPPAADIVLVPQYKRAQDDPRYTIQPSNRPHMAAGFCWNQTNADATLNSKDDANPLTLSLADALADLRVRGKDMSKLEPYLTTDKKISPPASAVQSKGDAPSSPTTSSWNFVASAMDVSSATPKIKHKPSPNTFTTAPMTRAKEDILVELKAMFFPLLATLLPRWHAQIADKYSNNQWNSHEIHKVLVLVTGVGTPRNWTHSITGNSTQALADLMELFLAKVYPDITVVKIHSDTNIFRYDDNIHFVQQELLPQVNAYRDAHATQAPYPHEVQSSRRAAEENKQRLQPHMHDDTHGNFDVNWKNSFSVTLSFADGSPARTHAIQTALRTFRPTYYHMWQLKTFWHERKIVDDDVEVHSFEEMETSPAIESDDLQGELDMVVQEMKVFRQEVFDIMQRKDSSDIHSFWLRKTHKAVLAVLLVQSEGSLPVLYRGTNMEVSMPTGSLCAERNVIGTALASNPKLKRQDLKCIAVLAVPQAPKPGSVPRSLRTASIGSASDYTGGGSAKNSRHNSIDESKSNLSTNASTLTEKQMRRESIDENGEEEEDWAVSYRSGHSNNNKEQRKGVETEVVVLNSDQQEQQAQAEYPGTPIRKISLFSSESSNSLLDLINNNSTKVSARVSSSPAKPKSSGSVSVGKEKKTIVRSHNHDIDLNPLRPCGACHEWLKKIAECNPYFQIMTFTDADCNGVYCTPCQE